MIRGDPRPHEQPDAAGAVSALLPVPVVQVLQVVTTAGAAPGVSGVIAQVEARLQGRRGPRVLQPYYDLAKLLRKEALDPEGASWVFLAVPIAAFTCYLTVPLLIPVLTTYPLPLGYMGDILGGGFILSLASFLVAVAALETGSPYAQLGASRAKTFAAITEPVILFVVFTVALLTGTDLPYALAAAFGRWTSIPTAAVSATRAGQLGEDVSGTNVTANADGSVSLPADIQPDRKSTRLN